MPTIELFKDGDRVIVDVGSEPETVWRGKGFSEVNAPKKAVEEQPEVVAVVEEQPIARKPGRPASK